MKRYKKKMNLGFTLVELMVSLSIFAITIVISVGTLLVMIDANAKAQALYSATTNLSYALDSMTREMRTGFYYYCTDEGENQTVLEPDEDAPYADCEGGGVGNFIAFTREVDGLRIGYRLKDGRIDQKTIDDDDPSNNVDWESITSSDLTINKFEVTVEGSEPFSDQDGNILGDTAQPTVVLHIAGESSNGLEEPTTFDIQTRITQRRIDNR